MSKLLTARNKKVIADNLPSMVEEMVKTVQSGNDFTHFVENSETFKKINKELGVDHESSVDIAKKLEQLSKGNEEDPILKMLRASGAKVITIDLNEPKQEAPKSFEELLAQTSEGKSNPIKDLIETLEDFFNGDETEDSDLCPVCGEDHSKDEEEEQPEIKHNNYLPEELQNILDLFVKQAELGGYLVLKLDAVVGKKRED